MDLHRGACASALDLAEQQRSGSRYDYSVYQAEYSRNLLFRDGAAMDRSSTGWWTAPAPASTSPPQDPLRAQTPAPSGPQEARHPRSVVVETLSYDLTWFKVTFGCLGLKAYTKGEHVLRIEATCHNAAELGCGRVLDDSPTSSPGSPLWPAGSATTLDSTSVGFLSRRPSLDELPRPAQLGPTRVGGIDLDSPRTRAALAAVAALAPAPKGFTVAELAAKVAHHHRPHRRDYTIRQAAYDLRKLRAKNLVVKPGRSRRYQVPTDAIRTIIALTTLRDQVLAPILAGVRNPRPGRKPQQLDRRRARLRNPTPDMQTLFNDLGISSSQPPHRQHFVDRMNASF